MASDQSIILAFDLYGTLLSTESIAKQLASHVGEEKAQAIAAKWRLYQLEYTWRLTSMGLFEPFSTVTLRSLQHALKEANVTLSGNAIDGLMKSYDSLSTFPDVQPALRALSKEPNIKAVVFSNGTQSMVSNSVNQSPDLSPHASVFESLIVVQPTKVFKPSPEVYYFLAEKCEKSRQQMGDMWLISGNPFDVVGARSVGMKAAWVDRQGNGWTDSLIEGDKGSPTIIVRGLDEVVDAVKKYIQSRS